MLQSPGLDAGDRYVLPELHARGVAGPFSIAFRFSYRNRGEQHEADRSVDTHLTSHSGPRALATEGRQLPRSDRAPGRHLEGGRANTVVVSSWHPNELYVASDSGGLFKSIDWGVRWT